MVRKTFIVTKTVEYIQEITLELDEGRGDLDANEALRIAKERTLDWESENEEYEVWLELYEGEEEGL